MAISSVREWAIANGWKVGTRGRFSKELLEAYAKANQSGSAPRKSAPSRKRKAPEPPPVIEAVPEADSRPVVRRHNRTAADKAYAKAHPEAVREGPIENDWTVSNHMVYNGRHIVVGTELSIKRERGRFRFMKLVQRPNGIEWIDVWGGPKKSEQWRSFRPDRIRTVHVKKTTDRSLVEARKSERARALANSRAMRSNNAKS